MALSELNAHVELIECGHCEETFERKYATGVWVFDRGIVVCPSCFCGFRTTESEAYVPKGFFSVAD